jgi:hypothetical protein
LVIGSSLVAPSFATAQAPDAVNFGRIKATASWVVVPLRSPAGGVVTITAPGVQKTVAVVGPGARVLRAQVTDRGWAAEWAHRGFVVKVKLTEQTAAGAVTFTTTASV